MLKPFQCTFCDFTTKLNCAQSKHVKEFHAREKTFKCETCLNYFRNKETLKWHQQMVHDNKKHFKCKMAMKVI